MPIDNDEKDVIRLGKDLQPGDFVKHGNRASIIYKIDGLSDFYGSRSHYEFFDLNDDGMGPYSSNLDINEEFTVVCSRREILRAYDIIELGLLRASANAMESRGNLVRVKKMAIDSLNKKLFNMKKKIVEDKKNERDESKL